MIIMKNVYSVFLKIFTLKVIVFSEYPIVGSDSDAFIMTSYIKILPKVIAQSDNTLLANHIRFVVYAEAEIGIDYLLYSLQVIIGEVLVFVKLFSESENTLLKSSYGS